MISNDVKEFKQEFAVLVVSCDKYSDLWDPYFYLFKRNWPDCPYKIYIGSNTIEYKSKYVNVITLFSGEDKDWSSSFRKILQQIPSQYLLVLHEDFFITSAVRTDVVEETIKFMSEIKAKHIHIRPVPKPDILGAKGNYSVYTKEMPYRVNVSGFWDRNYLISLLIDGESPWNFEIMGSYRTVFCEGFYCLNKELFKHINMVEKGCWIPKSVKWCRENGVNINISRRKLPTGLKLLMNKIKMVYFDTIIKINWKIRVNIMNILRKLLISY